MRGTHRARPTWNDRLSYAACATLVAAAPFAAANELDDRPPKLHFTETSEPGAPHGARDAGEQWAALENEKRYGEKYDMWSPAARAQVTRDDYLAVVRGCAASPKRRTPSENMRVVEVRSYRDGTATVWFTVREVRRVGPLVLQSSEHGYFQIYRFQGGRWWADPQGLYAGGMVAHLQRRRAACGLPPVEAAGRPQYYGADPKTGGQS